MYGCSPRRRLDAPCGCDGISDRLRERNYTQRRLCGWMRCELRRGERKEGKQREGWKRSVGASSISINFLPGHRGLHRVTRSVWDSVCQIAPWAVVNLATWYGTLKSNQHNAWLLTARSLALPPFCIAASQTRSPRYTLLAICYNMLCIWFNIPSDSYLLKFATKTADKYRTSQGEERHRILSVQRTALEDEGRWSP